MKNHVVYSKFNSYINFKKSKRYVNFFKLIFGVKGSGKTTMLSKYYLKSVRSNQYSAIYTSFPVTILEGSSTPVYQLDLNRYRLSDYFHRTGKWAFYRCYTNPVKDLKIDDTQFKIMENSLILLDELGILYFNRNYKVFDSHISNFFKTHRHFNIDIIANSQSYDIDKALRNSATELSLIHRRGSFIIEKAIDKTIAVGTDDNSMNADTCIYDKISFRKFFKKGALKFTFIPFYSDLFDSFG